MLLSSSELSEAARGGSQTRDQQASGNINVLGNKTHLSNAAAVPTAQQQQQCYKAKWRNGYTLGDRIFTLCGGLR